MFSRHPGLVKFGFALFTVLSLLCSARLETAPGWQQPSGEPVLPEAAEGAELRRPSPVRGPEGAAAGELGAQGGAQRGRSGGRPERCKPGWNRSRLRGAAGTLNPEPSPRLPRLEQAEAAEEAAGGGDGGRNPPRTVPI